MKKMNILKYMTDLVLCAFFPQIWPAAMLRWISSVLYCSFDSGLSLQSKHHEYEKMMMD